MDKLKTEVYCVDMTDNNPNYNQKKVPSPNPARFPYMAMWPKRVLFSYEKRIYLSNEWSDFNHFAIKLQCFGGAESIYEKTEAIQGQGHRVKVKVKGHFWHKMAYLDL